MSKDSIIASVVVVICAGMIIGGLIVNRKDGVPPKVAFNPGDSVTVPCGNGVLMDNYFGDYMLVRIDNGVGVVPRYSEVRFFKSEVSKGINVESK